ncbi:hypothetical protein FLAV_01593 [Flavobacteriales bacterium]|nr:hypothetical protein [Flavobacteriales bacterium]MCL4815986.1 hypothetical protein [Flavobacteriales bacterium]WKZ74316.1 MAG: transglutaminase-like domain-containing protein [Vicingaceae bacterium]GIK70620.1 MAG: hypothetical protein BroJett020_19150 [Bacteroidota bacterium]CAG0977680.1 hypothetical protein FLAV_01593 [Flavobacteriales bacterium]
MQVKEISALIRLLEDPDETVFYHVKDKILSFGNEVIPLLESAWETSFEPLMQKRIENIIHQLQFVNIKTGIREWYLAGGKDLLSGVLFVAKYQYPDLNEEKIKHFINQLSQDVWLELNDYLTAPEKVKVINKILYDIHGFSGNKTNFHSPQNSFINTVLESKKGNPLSLGIVYLLVCNKLSMPVLGVNLPEHFVLAYIEDNIFKFGQKIERKDILFYINPFNRGFIFSSVEIDKFIQQINIMPSESHYLPCKNTDIVVRMLKNLVISYQKLGYAEKQQEIEELLKVFSE